MKRVNSDRSQIKPPEATENDEKSYSIDTILK